MNAFRATGFRPWLACLFGALVGLATTTAQAVPAYARQTGQNCVACHVSFPELTPYGRWFKLSGYTIGERQTIPLAMMAQVARSTTKNNEDSSGAPINARNNQFALNGASLFLAGKATDNIGGFIQWTYSQAYDPAGGSVGHSSIDNTDLRAVGRVMSADGNDVKLLYGLTVHNNPTAQDVWNSTPAFGFPFSVSPTAGANIPGTKIEGGLAGEVAGIGGYVFYDKTWYAELTAYRSADGAFKLLSEGIDIADRLKGYNPYFRFAYNKEWEANSMMVGVFGLRVHQYLDPADTSSGTDSFTDLGVDAQYQFISNPHTFTAQASYIKERQHWDATFPSGGSANPTNDLSSVKVKATYYYDRKYGITLAGFSTHGSTDALLYAPGEVTGSATGSPNTQGYIVEVDYLPIQNVRLMAQYTGYRKLGGSSAAGYDGVSSRSPSDNNTLMLNVWVAF